MVVLATTAVSCEGSESLAQKLHVSYDAYKFIAEAHPKLKPVETNTAGIYLAGACQSPKDIPESVAAASGAAAKVLGLFANNELTREPVVAKVNRMPPPLFSTCMGCEMCMQICPYQAITMENIKDRGGNVIKQIAHINPGLCQGCGTCVSFCKSKSIDLEGYTTKQMYEEVLAILNK
jgi:heterodisulfide reductase subunit A